MSEQASSPEGGTPLESLLADALRPIEPPEDLASRVKSTLMSVADLAERELSDWREELSESELESLRDPRNWVRPVAAAAAGAAAGGALLVLGLRRRKPSGGENPAQSIARGLRDRLG